MSTPQPPEDRLRAALSDRAAAARTSSDALDGVFTKVSRHRRNARLAAAGAGTTLAILAGVLVVSTSATPGQDRVVPASASPDAGATPTTSPSPTVSPSPTASPVPLAYPKDRAMVALRDGRIVEVSTTTGAVVRGIGNALDGTEDWNAASLDWAEHDRDSLVLVVGCMALRVDAEAGLKGDLGNGHEAVISPDGRYVAMRDCEKNGDLHVLDLRTGRSERFERPTWTPPAPGQGTPDIDSISVVTELDWYDADSLLVTRNYEGAEEALLLDVVPDDELDDGERLGFDASSTARGPGRLAWSNANHEAGVRVSTRPDGGRETVLFQRPGVTKVAYDARGVLLFVDGKGLWRWDDDGATLLVEDAVLVAG